LDEAQATSVRGEFEATNILNGLSISISILIPNQFLCLSKHK